MKRTCGSLLILVVLASPGYAEICFSEQDAGAIVVEIEQGRACKEIEATLTEQVALIEQRDKVLREALDLCMTQVTNSEAYAEAAVAQCNEACEVRVDAVKPSFWGSAAKVLSGLGIGVVLGLAAGLL